MKTYLVTGSTGAIGACLVPMLLDDQNTQVRLLIRARDQQHIAERLQELLSFWGYPFASSTAKRIKAYRSDVTLPLFGLDRQEYEALASECSHIIHSAGNVRMNLSMEEARKSSVDSTSNISAFAWRCRENGILQKVEFVSTVGVGGRLGGIVPETWLTEKRSFHNTYEEAKAEAEEMIRSEIEAGLPVTVHRPSMVVGRSDTGEIIHFQVFYHICEFLSGRRTFGLVPSLENAFLDIIPVDYVAKIIRWSSERQETVGKILHLCSGPEHAIPIEQLKSDIRSIYRSTGTKLPLSFTIPLPFFKSGLPLIGLFLPAPAKRAIKALPFLFDYLEEVQKFSNEKTRKVHERDGIDFPLVGDYLKIVVEYYIQKMKR
ncbi:MAG: SDR family oxidoreductase [Geobacteraceae bacterium]|nr:SDR family oxidoreductase [Geobacteraceae bacterium]